MTTSAKRAAAVKILKKFYANFGSFIMATYFFKHIDSSYLLNGILKQLPTSKMCFEIEVIMTFC